MNPFLDSSTLVTELTYFKSAGVRQIEFARIVKASLQLGKSAKSPQTSTPVPGWEICGDSEHFRPPRKMRAAKIASTPTGKNRKKGAEPWRIRTSHLGSEGTGLQATWVQGVTAGYLEEGGPSLSSEQQTWQIPANGSACQLNLTRGKPKHTHLPRQVSQLAAIQTDHPD